MPPFCVTVFDPDEEYDDTPESLTPLDRWLASQRAGAAPFEPDGDEGFGILFDDGSARYLDEGFGSARALAFGLREAAVRLEAGEVAILCSSYLGPPSRLLLIPDDDGVRIARVTPSTRPPGDWDAHAPGPRASTPEQIAAVRSWAAAIAEEQLTPTGKPAADTARGLDVYIEREELIPALRRGADDAFAAAQLLRSRSFADGDRWTPLSAHQTTTAPPPSTSLPPPHQPIRLRVSRIQPEGERLGSARVQIIKIIRTFTGHDYKGGKALYAQAVAGEGFELAIDDPAQAASIHAELQRLGAVVEAPPG